MASFTDQNGTPIKTTEQLQSWYKSQGYDWEKLDPELKQQALTGIGEQDRGFLAGARRIAASGAEGLTSLVTAPLTTLPGLVETGLAFGAEKLGATDFAKTMRSDAAQSFALGQKIQRGVSGALRSEYDLAQQQIDKRAIDAAATAAEKQGAGFFGQAGAEIKEYGSQILESPSKALEIGANVLAQGLGAGKLASAGSKKLLDAELKAVGKKGLKGDALREAGDAAVARVNKSIEFNTKAINAGLVSSDSASGAWENISKIPDSTWMNQAEYYDRVIAGNENSETVKEDIATRWVSAAGAAGLAGGLALNRIVGTPLESAFAKSFANSQKVAPAKGWGAAIKGAGKGALEETSEEVALGAFVPNVAAQQINPEQRLSEGVGQAFVAGLGGGASVGGLTGFRGQQSDKAPDITSTLATTPVVPGETKVIVPDEGDQNAVQVESPTSQVLPTPEGGQVGVGLSSLGKVNQSDSQVAGENSVNSQAEKLVSSPDVLGAVERTVIPSLYDSKILRGVISSIPVDVMDNFIGSNGSTESILGDPSVLTNALRSSPNRSVAARIYANAATLMGAESSVLGDVARGDIELISTKLAGLEYPGAEQSSGSNPAIDGTGIGAEQSGLPNRQENISAMSAVDGEKFTDQESLQENKRDLIIEEKVGQGNAQPGTAARKPFNLAARANAQPAGAVADTTAGAPNRVGDGNQKPPAKGVTDETQTTGTGQPQQGQETAQEVNVDQIVEDSNGAIIPKCNL